MARQKRAAAALLAGRAEDYVQMLTSPDPDVSVACRKEQARLNPVLFRCTSEEKSIILQKYREMWEAVAQGDAVGTLETLDELERALSHECWVASNYPQDRRIQAACSATERRLVAEAASAFIAAAKQVLQGDVTAWMRPLQILGELSPKCQSAMATVQAESQGRSPGGRASHPPGSPPSGFGAVEDHGGGTLIAPGLGACTPTGCMAF